LQIFGNKSGTLTINIIDVQIYDSHIEFLKEQIEGEGSYSYPELRINPEIITVDDLPSVISS